MFCNFWKKRRSSWHWLHITATVMIHVYTDTRCHQRIFVFTYVHVSQRSFLFNCFITRACARLSRSREQGSCQLKFPMKGVWGSSGADRVFSGKAIYHQNMFSYLLNFPGVKCFMVRHNELNCDIAENSTGITVFHLGI